MEVSSAMRTRIRGEPTAERVSLRVGISEVLILNFLRSWDVQSPEMFKVHVEAATNVSLASGTN
jgi:hypothetical protein